MPYSVNPDTGYLEYRDSAGSIGAIDEIKIDSATFPGTDPVLPDASGRITVTGGQVVSGTVGTKVIRARSTAANSYIIQVQQSGSSAAEDTALNGVAHFDSSDFTVSNGFVSLAAEDETITGNSGGALSPTDGNWNILGVGETTTSGSVSTLSILSPRVAEFIVDATQFNGTHQTIAAAIAAASSGDTIFIRPGTYTENLTLKAGVNLAAFAGDDDTPTVTIIGNNTFSGAGTTSISNIRLQTNGAALLTVSGASASIVNLNKCYLNCTNSTGIVFSSSNASSKIKMTSCKGDIGTTGIALFSQSSTGTLLCLEGFFSNDGGSSTANTVSAGNATFFQTALGNPTTSSGTGSIGIFYSNVDTSATNSTSVTVGGTGTHNFFHSTFFSGTASAISIAQTATIQNCVVDSTNVNAITGVGTIIYGEITFSNTSSLINTTTKSGRNINSGGISFDGGTNILSTYTVSTFTPTLFGNTVAGTTTYTFQDGYYTRIGNLVTCIGRIVATAATGTGNARIGGLPFTIKSQTGGIPIGSISIQAAGWSWGAGLTSLAMYGTINNTNAQILISGSSNAGNFLQMSNAAITINFTFTYQI